jgi:hypothetical protein
MRQRLFALLISVAACSCSRDAGEGSATNSTGVSTDDPPTRAARLSSVDGAVSWRVPGSDAWSRPTVNSTVSTGYRLSALAGARAELDVGTAAVRLASGTDAVVSNLTGDFMQVGLAAGTLEAGVYDSAKDDSLEIDTPNGALVPTDAGTYVVTIEPDGGGTVVSVVKGALRVTGPAFDKTLTTGQVVRLAGTDRIRSTALGWSYVESQPVFAALDRWRSRRDPLFMSTGNSSRYVAPSIPGWEDLDDNGVWVVDAEQKHAWCPKNVSADWIPYRVGRWSWVEPWGWTWVGDEPWGYAPFHYGRWETVTDTACASGWAWIPGPVVARPVWSPALVAFVDGAALRLARGPDVEAWFPLGPREPFFPWYHHSQGYLREVNATNLLEVRAIDSLVRDRDVRDYRRVNRDTALTVVASAVFARGEAVLPRAIPTRSDLLPPVRIAAHPSVNPVDDLVAGGVRVTEPRIGDLPERRALIARNVPPPERLAWAARQPAMSSHPGRPLEPAQIAKLRAGQDAGSPRDAEVPVHRVESAPPSGAAELNAQLQQSRPMPRRQTSAQSPETKAGERGGGSMEE